MLEAELMERDRWTRDDLLTYQAERVRALLAHAVNRSPYYREVLGADAAERPLAELPTLSKATLMAEFDRVVTDPQLRLADLRAHLSSTDPSDPSSAGTGWQPPRVRPGDGRSSRSHTTRPPCGGPRAQGP